MIKRLQQFWDDECGANAIEYALIGTLIGLAIIAAADILGVTISGFFGATATTLENLSNQSGG